MTVEVRTILLGEQIADQGGQITLNAQEALARVVDAIEELQSSPVSGGSGLPSGGTAGQVLTKQSATDGDAAWEDIVITGGGA